MARSSFGLRNWKYLLGRKRIQPARTKRHSVPFKISDDLSPYFNMAVSLPGIVRYLLQKEHFKRYYQEKMRLL